MPQIQILPSIPTFGSRLAESLGNAGVNIAEGFKQRSNRTAIDNLTKELADPNKTDLQKVGILTKLTQRLGPEVSKSLQPFFANLAYKQAGVSGQPPGTPHVEGVPTGENEPITAETQPTGVQNAPAPTGQTNSERDIRKAQLRNFLNIPGVSEQAKNELDEIKAQEEREFRLHKDQLVHERKQQAKQEEKIAEFQKNIVKSYEAAQVSRSNLDAMQKLIDSDKLIHPLGAYLTEKFGIPISLVGEKETEKFEKLSAQRGLNVGAAYGFGRILDKEFENFLGTIPSKLNSKEGKQEIVDTLRYADDLAEARYEKYKQIRKELGPNAKAEDLELAITEAMKPEFEKFGEILKNGYSAENISDFDPTKLKGERIEDDEGNIYESNGKEWVKVGG